MKQLRKLGAYLHQDWHLDYDSVWDAVRSFKGEATSDDVRAAIEQASRLRDSDYDEDELKRIVVDDLGIDYWPPGDGLSFRAWLDEVVRTLADLG